MFLRLTANATYLDQNHWFIDGAFAVHPNMTSHTGAYMTFGKGVQADQAPPRQYKRTAVGVEWTGVHQQTHPPREHPLFLRRERGQAKCRISLGEKGHMSLLIDSPTNIALRWSI